MSDKIKAFGIEGETPQEGEWPKRDVEQNQPSITPANVTLWLFRHAIPVTPEMLAAGRHDIQAACLEAFGSDWANDIADIFATAAYRAMAALAPVELVSAGELAAVRERDALKYDLKVAHEDIETYAKALTRAAADIDVRDARIAELDTRLALGARETDSDKKPMPASKEFPAGALRLSGGDPRRVGG